MNYRTISVGKLERDGVRKFMESLPEGLLVVKGNSAYLNVNVADRNVSISPADGSRITVNTEMEGVSVEGSGPGVLALNYRGRHFCVQTA